MIPRLGWWNSLIADAPGRSEGPPHSPPGPGWRCSQGASSSRAATGDRRLLLHGPANGGRRRPPAGRYVGEMVAGAVGVASMVLGAGGSGRDGVDHAVGSLPRSRAPVRAGEPVYYIHYHRPAADALPPGGVVHRDRRAARRRALILRRSHDRSVRRRRGEAKRAFAPYSKFQVGGSKPRTGPSCRVQRRKATADDSPSASRLAVTDGSLLQAWRSSRTSDADSCRAGRAGNCSGVRPDAECCWEPQGRRGNGSANDPGRVRRARNRRWWSVLRERCHAPGRKRWNSTPAFRW